MRTDTLKDVARICRMAASFARNHFIVLGLICVLLLVFRVFPSVLRFFISSSPLVICTAIFLRALLSIGTSDGTQNGEICTRSGIGKEKPEDFSKVEYDTLINVDSNESVQGKTNDELDDVECSSAENVPINILPVIDEIDPLLDPKVPCLPLMEELDQALESSDKSIDESGESEAENNQAKASNGNGAKSLVNWTEDDQKNLMDLGCSEVERNQRLESLIARRRARKNFLRLSEKSLMDFDSNNDTSFQVPSITTMKNPFNVPFNSSDFDGLIPGSAPSVLVPRKNPFDLPYDPQEEKPNLTQDSFHQEYMQIFCRHESFSLGSANRQERYNPRFTPFFADEENESSEGVESSSSNAQSGSLPPIDPKNRKKKMGRVMSLGVYHSNDRRERKFADVPLIRISQEARHDSSFHDGAGGSPEAEIVSEKYDESSPSPSSEINEEAIDVTNGVEPSVADVVKKQYSDSKEEALEETDLNNQVMEEVKDACIKEAAYDSSDSSSSMASDMHVEVSETGSPGEPYRFLNPEALWHGRIDKRVFEARYNVVLPTENRAVAEHNAVKNVVPGHVSTSENLGVLSVEPEVAAEPPADSSNSILSQLEESKGKDHMDEESEAHVEQDTVTIDSKAPSLSPSSDLDKGETLAEYTSVRPNSHMDHYGHSQEKGLKATDDANKIEIVKEALSDDGVPRPSKHIEINNDIAKQEDTPVRLSPHSQEQCLDATDNVNKTDIVKDALSDYRNSTSVEHIEIDNITKQEV